MRKFIEWLGDSGLVGLCLAIEFGIALFILISLVRCAFIL